MNGWTIHEAGMAQLDDIVGATMQKLKDMGVDDNTIVMFTAENGTENFTWPDGGQTPFYGGKGTTYEGGFRAPAMIRWAGHVPVGSVGNGLISGLDWFPTFTAAAGNANIAVELKAGKEMNGQKYKVHLDGYDQTSMITASGPSNRHEIWYFGESTLGAARVEDYKYTFKEQPGGWLGDTVTLGAPTVVNLRLDPFERTAFYKGNTGSLEYFEWFKFEFAGEIRRRIPTHAGWCELRTERREGTDCRSHEEAGAIGSPAFKGRLARPPAFAADSRYTSNALQNIQAENIGRGR
jgi:arylsulfatase A-like enzyme